MAKSAEKDFYSPSQRALQDEFASRGLADRLHELIVRDSFDEQTQAVVEAADFFFLSSVDADGFPTVSHKGGAPGFVKVHTPNTLLFPTFDGNGMQFSTGNIEANNKVGLLFINFENPHRVRIHGEATLIRTPEVLALWPETALAVEISISKMWINCPRYIHRMQPLEATEFVPQAGRETPQPEWKSFEPIADVVPPPAHTLKKKTEQDNL